MVHCDDVPEMLERPAEPANIRTQVLHLPSNTSFALRVRGLVGQAVIVQPARDEGTRFRGIYPAQATGLGLHRGSSVSMYGTPKETRQGIMVPSLVTKYGLLPDDHTKE